MADWKFYISTFGCKINQYESQAITEAWTRAGGVATAKPEEAEYICINSCAITANAEREARNAIYRLRKSAPGAKIILTGCAAQFFPDFLPRRNANYAKPDFVIPQKNKDWLYQHPAALLRSSLSQPLVPITGFSRARPIIKIQDGCSQNCSYCIVPQTRGKPVSRRAGSILEECRALLNAGFSELVLSGVNLLQYRADCSPNSDFWELVKYLLQNLRADYAGAFRLRLSSIDPALLTEKALEIILGNSEICRHLHLSLQHASEKILQAMRRKHYQPDKILQKIKILQENGPLGLGADFLLGFPGETEDDVKILEDYCTECRFSYAHVFPFSARRNTVAQKLANQLPAAIKKSRAARITEIIAKGKRLFLNKQLELAKCHFVGITATEQKNGQGVNEFYVKCQLAHSGGDFPQKGIVPVKPLRLEKDLLVVELI